MKCADLEYSYDYNYYISNNLKREKWDKCSMCIHKVDADQFKYVF